ncbi:uncharacterized protein LOC120076083 [Benincasa hispida]|uniref:uncharacterized protein LOC120076083 n=1 Tax=Benincasa hispida TaxID=102211 RepID=UPI001901296A|nr:uncharacterized protein LOC120076083 [Benincasa hispida]
MDKRTFMILCNMIRTTGCLEPGRYVGIEEMVAMFLHILAHNVKNRVVRTHFSRFNETVSRYFNVVLRVVIQLHTVLLKTLEPVTRYYYLCNAGYPNAKGFLAPYRRERYHLSNWRGAGNTPTTSGKFFNMKHSSARNIIERAFGLLKGRWAILRGKSIYLIQVKCRTITACCLIHNLITKEMGIGASLDDSLYDNPASTVTEGENIEFIETSDKWTKFRDDLVAENFSQWQKS